MLAETARAGRRRGIVAIEVAVESIEAKRKLSQSRNDDIDSVIAVLDALDTPRSRSLAAAMTVEDHNVER